MVQAVIVAVIVIGAAWGLYRCLRKKPDSAGCDGCPLVDSCSKRKSDCGARKPD